MLLTNKTFIKGVGMPTNMAPVVHNKDKYKKPSIISFGMMLFQDLAWAMRT